MLPDGNKLRHILRLFICMLLCFGMNAPLSYAQHKAVQEFNKGRPVSSGTPKAKLKNDPLPKSLLWEISGNGLAQPSYLFGTIHMICATDYLWQDYMQAAFDRTNELILEIDMDEVEQEYGNLFGTLGSTGLNLPSIQDGTDDRLLDSVIANWQQVLEDPEVRPYIDELFEIMGLDDSLKMNLDSVIYALETAPDVSYNTGIDNDAEIESEVSDASRSRDSNIDNILVDANGGYKKSRKTIREPYRASRIAAGEEEAEVSEIVENLDILPPVSEPDGTYYGFEYIDGCDRMVSYEGKLTIMARSRDMSVSGLESIDEQLDVLMSGTDEYERVSLEEFPDLDINESLKYLTRIYITQDLNQLFDLMTVPEMGVHDLDAYLFDRNEKWMKKIPALMKSGSKFIAVGAGHLPGEKGLIQLLKNKGYTIKPVFKK